MQTTKLCGDRRTWLAAAGALLLSACGKQEGPATDARPSTPITIDAIAAQAKGFTVGQAMRAQSVYVFFDPQCPHCAALWNETKPLLARAKFVWVPVALMGPKSLGQGGAILSAPDPVAAMEQNEASVLAQQGGISAVGISAESKEPVQKNTELFDRLGLSSVPSIVARNTKTGELVTISGALPAAQLAERLGL
jgi:thiol:disulfide interchange protein DsbG